MVVGDDVLVAREAVILATGSTASMPPIPGLAEAGAWSNRQMTTAKEVPARLLILGGGVVGVEMAQAWMSLGSHVTLIEAADSLLTSEEPFVGEEIGQGLGALGADLLFGAKAVAVRRGRGPDLGRAGERTSPDRRPAARCGGPPPQQRRARAAERRARG